MIFSIAGITGHRSMCEISRMEEDKKQKEN